MKNSILFLATMRNKNKKNRRLNMRNLILITMIIGLQAFGYLKTSFNVMTKEKNNVLFLKQGVSLEYTINKIGVGLSTTSGILENNVVLRNYYRDIELYTRYYNYYMLFGASCVLRYNNLLLDKNIYYNIYFEIECGPNIQFKHIDINLPIKYKINLKEIVVCLEFVIKFDEANY